jgi:3-oxoadipate enol-lactonase
MLPQVKVPAMGMYGEKDIIVSPTQWQPMQEGIPLARIERFSTAGHFVMLDDPDPFNHKLKEFLDEDKPAP